MDAETGATHQPIARAEFEQQFGDAGYEAHDAGVGSRYGMHASDCIGDSGGIAIHAG